MQRSGESSAATANAPPALPPGVAAPGCATVLLPVNCTIGEIGGLHDCLRSAPLGALLDGSAVRRIDSAGVRLLVAHIRERRAARGSVQWKAASAALSDAVAMLGMATAVSLPAAP